jgi:hypothetical protein
MPIEASDSSERVAEVAATVPRASSEHQQEPITATVPEVASSAQVTGTRCPPNVDPEVFAELPEDMQQELIEQYRTLDPSHNLLIATTELDRDALAALPDNLRQEVLREEAAERRRREPIDESVPAQQTVSRAATQPGTSTENNDNAMFIASLAPDLRQEALIAASDVFLSTLPESVQNEARQLRERYRMNDPVGMDQAMFGAMRRAIVRRDWALGANTEVTWLQGPYASSRGATAVGSNALVEPLRSTAAQASDNDPLTLRLTDNRKGRMHYGRRLVARLLSFVASGEEQRVPKPFLRLFACLCKYQSGRGPLLRLLVSMLHADTDSFCRLFAQLPVERKCLRTDPASRTQSSSEMDVEQKRVSGHDPKNDEDVQRLITQTKTQMPSVNATRRLLAVLVYLYKKADNLVFYDIMRDPSSSQVGQKSGGDSRGGEWIFKRLIMLLATDYGRSRYELRASISLLVVFTASFTAFTLTSCCRCFMH